MTETPAPPGYGDEKEAYLKRLRRIEGQARGLQRMVAEDQYCIDILTQVSAMTKALQAVALDSGRLALTTDSPVDDDAVRAAVAEAGYAVR